MYSKFVSGTVIVALIALCATTIIHNGSIRKKDAEIARLEAQLLTTRKQLNDADAAIGRQNAAVEAVRIDTVLVEKKITEVVTKYNRLRDTIILSTERDTGCENQIANICGILRGFGGGLRAENSDNFQ
jgi:peptidoglycan hydrolase CwlO-like protein